MDAEYSPAPQAGGAGIEVLQELADSLQHAHAAVLRSDLPQILNQTARQRELCARLGEGSFRDDWAEPIRKVAGLTRSYAALLRRARRTVDIFCRVLAHSALTYPPPRREPGSLPVEGAE